MRHIIKVYVLGAFAIVTAPTPPTISEGAARLGQPAVGCELAAGMGLATVTGLVGSSLPFMTQLASGKALEHIMELGIFFLML